MICPECQSTNIKKNGLKRGKQNHICKGCGRQFREIYSPEAIGKKSNDNAYSCMLKEMDLDA